MAYPGPWRVVHVIWTLETPLELGPIYHSTEGALHGHAHGFVLCHTLVRVEDRLDAAGMHPNACDALERLDPIKRASITLAEPSLERTSARDDEQTAILRAEDPTTRPSLPPFANRSRRDSSPAQANYDIGEVGSETPTPGENWVRGRQTVRTCLTSAGGWTSCARRLEPTSSPHPLLSSTIGTEHTANCGRD